MNLLLLLFPLLLLLVVEVVLVMALSVLPCPAVMDPTLVPQKLLESNLKYLPTYLLGRSYLMGIVDAWMKKMKKMNFFFLFFFFVGWVGSG